MSARDAAVADLPKALKWVIAASGALDAIIGFNGTRAQIASLPQFISLQTHFHITLGPPPAWWKRILDLCPFSDALGIDDAIDPTLGALKLVRAAYLKIGRTLQTPSIFIDSPDPSDLAYLALTPTPRDGTIHVTTNYVAANVGPLYRLLSLVHESAHFMSDGIQDYAYRDRSKKPESDEPLKYIQLPSEYAIRNADSYAYYGLEMATGIKRVIAQTE